MTWYRHFSAMGARLKAVILRRRTDQDLEDELTFHLSMQTRANLDQGLTQAEAARRARLTLGGIEQVKEQARDVRPLRWMQDIMHDVRYGLRSLRTSPRFTIAAVLTVVLGVGANTTIFSVLNPLLFKPLPYPEPDRIVNVFRTSPQSDRWPHSTANYLDHRNRNTVFEQLAAMTWRDASLADPDQPAERLFGIRATGNFFALLGVPAEVGRTFTPEDDVTGAEPVVVLSHRFWQRRFGGDAGIIGRSMRLDGRETTVIGVMPDEFEYPLFWGTVDIWRPFAFPAEQLANRGNNFLREYGRLKPGVTPEQADAEMKSIAKQLIAEHGERLDARESMRIEPLSIASPVQRRVSAFAFGLTFLVLMIACVNLANLQLARTAARAREFAIRAAIGGRKWRLMRQSLTESLLLSFIGGVLAIPLSMWCTRLIATRQFADLPGVRITLDPVTLAFAFGCAVLTGVVFGAVPSWLASRADINDVLKRTTTSMVSGRTPHRFRSALIVAEIAFALIILAGSVSLIRGLQRLTGIDPGWRAENVVAARLNLVGPRYQDFRARQQFFGALETRLTGLPRIDRVALSTSTVPAFPFGSSTTYVREGSTDPLLAYNESVTPGYFDVLGVPLRRGRFFTPDDREGRTLVIIVNETMARRLWPNEDPIGKRIGFRGAPDPNWQEVVGVVGDITFPSFASTSGVDTDMQTFRPIAQSRAGSVSIIARTSNSSEVIAGDLQRAAASIDADLPVYDLRTAREIEQRNTAQLRLLGQVLGAFALLGLLLSAVGIFGVVSYSTMQRSGELGMRMALGARQSEVLWLVLRQGVRTIAMGAGVGLAGGIALERVLSSLMPRLPQPELLILAGASALMIAVALLAFYIPAWRASRISPMLVLRHE